MEVITLQLRCRGFRLLLVSFRDFANMTFYKLFVIMIYTISYSFRIYLGRLTSLWIVEPSWAINRTSNALTFGIEEVVSKIYLSSLTKNKFDVGFFSTWSFVTVVSWS